MIRSQRNFSLATTALLCSAVLFAAEPARAFRTADDLPSFDAEIPVTWEPAVLVSFELVGDLPEGIAQQDLIAAFDAASATWDRINCAGPDVMLSWLARDSYAAGDRVNTLAFVSADELPGGQLSETPAVTELQYEQADDGLWRIVEADIYVNRERDWNAGTDAWSVDLASALAHELGHVVGLLHPCEPSGADGAPECEAEHEAALMFPLYYAMGTALGEDDLLGYCYLYPEQRCRPGDRGCVPAAEVAPCVLETCGDAGAPGAVDAAVETARCDGGACEVPACASDEQDAGCLSALEFASACTSGDQCASGLCQGEDERSATCTRLCGGEHGHCPSGFACAALDGKSVCVGSQDSSGCSAARAGSLRAPGSVTRSISIATALFFFARRRSRARSRVPLPTR